MPLGKAMMQEVEERSKHTHGTEDNISKSTLVLKNHKCFMWSEKKKLKNDRILLNHEKEILPFSTIWMELEGIMLNEMSRQRKTNTV